MHAHAAMRLLPINLDHLPQYRGLHNDTMMASNQDITDGTASLAELAVSQGLIGRKKQQVIDGAQTPFEKAGQFV